MTKEEFIKQVIEIICDCQNVGLNRSNVPFVDVEQEFYKIVQLALDNRFIIKNEFNGLLVPIK